MKRILSGLLNPVLLSLWVTILILLFFPIKIDKYVSRLVDKGVYANDEYIIRYDDLDFDGSSEKIAVFHNSLGIAALTVSNAHGVLGQWTFRGNYGFVQHSGNVMTCDCDGNGLKEIYAFTLAGDSVLLNCIPDYHFEQPRKIRFVSRVGMRQGMADPFIIPGAPEDLTKDLSQELIFAIGTGYSLYPRSVYAYDLVCDSFLVSPESGYFINGILQGDLGGDHRNEILPFGYAASNVHDSTVPYADRDSWLMVLDQELKFAFNPVSFRGEYSNLQPAILKDAQKGRRLVALYIPPENLGGSNFLISFDSVGNKTNEIPVPTHVRQIMSITDRKQRSWLLLFENKVGFHLYDEHLVLHRSVPADSEGVIKQGDIDQDGTDEILVFELSQRKVRIYRSELNHPVVMEIDGESEKGLLYSLKIQRARKPLLYLQYGKSYFLYDYVKNPSYPFKYAIIALLYAGIFLFILLVRKIQRNQLMKKEENEKLITDLQLQLVRNQLDPHFIMNAINSIIMSIGDKEKEVAKQQLVHFSRLHRSLLLSSDKIQRSLQEELEFTTNYLALEKFRFREKFDYTLHVDPATDLEVKLPKMILQIHAENALKHGIMPLTKKGLLSIRIYPHLDGHCLEITDNGVGRDYARKHAADTTGKGIALLEQYAVLFNKVYPGKISMSTEDRYDEFGTPAGTTVRIILSGSR